MIVHAQEGVTEEEKKKVVEEIEAKNPGKEITEVEIEIDGDYLNCHYHFAKPSFERIRRITGYLVGTLDRFNNAKKAEVQDRVKHNRYSDPSELAK